MSRIRANLEAVQDRIARACFAYGRPTEAVRLVAVGKGFGPEPLRAALAAGQRDFGESYLQEAVAKIPHLPRSGVTWHFIGPIQSNKTRGIAEHFDWAHGVARIEIAQRLNDQRPDDMARLQVCVQVNISAEASKSGCTPEEAPALCETVAALPRLQLRGLMAIPAPAMLGRDVRADYRKLRTLYESLRQSGMPLDTLSAGMSDDFELAIAEGSTLVRVGTAIFGERTR